MIDATRPRTHFPAKLVGGVFLLIVGACLVQPIWRAVDPSGFSAAQARAAVEQADRAKVEATEEVKAKLDRNAYLLTHPEKANLDEGNNLRRYGHFWSQTPEEIAADKSWETVEYQKTNFVPVGTDYHPYNARLTKAYRHWEMLELAAYGKDWKRYWQENHAGDGLSNCPALAKSGMPQSECYKTEWSKGEVEPLEPMLMHCNSGDGIVPFDEASCRAHRAGALTETS